MVCNDAQLASVIFNKLPSLIYCCDVTTSVGKVNLAHRAGTTTGDDNGSVVNFAFCPVFQCKATVIRIVRVTSDEIRKRASTRGAESLWIDGECGFDHLQQINNDVGQPNTVNAPMAPIPLFWGDECQEIFNAQRHHRGHRQRR